MTDLAELLSRLDACLDDQVYVFAVGAGSPTAEVVAWFREGEGETWVLPQTAAESLGLRAWYPCRRIELRVASSLEAVGLLAAVTTTLARSGISVNAFSALHHDHLFVPLERADEALALLSSPSRPIVG